MGGPGNQLGREPAREGSKENIREGEGEGWKKGELVSSSFAINTVNLSPI